MADAGTIEVLNVVLEIVREAHHTPAITGMSAESVDRQMLTWTIAMAVAIIAQAFVAIGGIVVTRREGNMTRAQVTAMKAGALKKSRKQLHEAERIMLQLKPDFEERTRLGSGSANKEHAAGALPFLDELTRELAFSDLDGTELEKALHYRQVICRSVAEWAKGPDDGCADQIADRLNDAARKFEPNVRVGALGGRPALEPQYEQAEVDHRAPPPGEDA